jgi:hypothetical protein
VGAPDIFQEVGDRHYKKGMKIKHKRCPLFQHLYQRSQIDIVVLASAFHSQTSCHRCRLKFFREMGETSDLH